MGGQLWGPTGVLPSGGPPPSVWGDHGTNVALSTTVFTNDTATGLAASFSSVRGTQAYNSGKHYFEVKVLSFPTTPNFIPGIMDDTTANGAPMDGNALPNSIGNGMFNGGTFGTGTGWNGVGLGSGFSLANNDILGFAVDHTNQFYYLSQNNVYFLSGDPTSGPSGTGFVGNGAMANARPMLSLFGASNGVFQLITSSAALSFLPSGYTAWG